MTIQVPTPTEYSSYNPFMTWKDKIKYVVILKGQAGIKEITDFIAEKEPGKNWNGIYSTIANNVSNMVNEQKTLIAKQGKGKQEYQYVGK